MPILHFYEEHGDAHDDPDPVVSHECDLLLADDATKNGIIDLLAYLSSCCACRTCDQAGLISDASHTGDPNLYHLADPLTCSVAALLTVSVDGAGQLTSITVLRLCRTASAFAPVADIHIAAGRLAKHRERQ